MRQVVPSEVITQALKTQKKYSLGRNVSKVASTEVWLATILWTTTEADNQSSLHYAVRLTGSHLPHWMSRCKLWRRALEDMSIQRQFAYAF